MQPNHKPPMPEPLVSHGNLARRALDVTFSLLALACLAPVFVVIALCILVEDGRPIFFVQQRMGRGGRPFRIFKFRSMANHTPGTSITVAGDRRVTRIGAVLRKFKLDEMAQFINVLLGDMSVCGPRPEIPRYVDFSDPLWRQVLRERPGITDPASLLYRNEEQVLAAAEDPEIFYQQILLPAKLRISLSYLQRRSVWSDLKLILFTARYSFAPATVERGWIKRVIVSGGM